MSIRLLRRRNEQPPVVAAAETVKRRIKSDSMRHSWQVTGTGQLYEFPTTSARCETCGETANGFTAPLDRFLLIRAYGCARDGFDGTFQRNDQVVVAGRLDHFVNYLPDGKCVTGNAGGGTYVENVANLKPRTL